MPTPPNITKRIIIPDAVNGIDIAGFQDKFDAELAYQAGFRFAYVQCSLYSKDVNKNFQSQVSRLKAAGFAVGAYHFMAHDTDPVKQAQHFFRSAGGLGTGPNELPPMGDWEYCTPSKYKDHPMHCVDFAVKFMDETQRLWYPKNQRMSHMYTYPFYVTGHRPAWDSRVAELSKYGLVYASYGSRGYVPRSKSELPFTTLPFGFVNSVMVQYSGNDSAPVPGFNYAVDRLCFMGNLVEYDALINGAARGKKQ